MTPGLVALARALVALPDWPDGRHRDERFGFRIGGRWLPSAYRAATGGLLPDLTDAATGGVLLGMLPPGWSVFDSQLDAFHRGCRADGRWVCRGFRRAFALRLEEAGLVMASGGYQGPFEIRFTEAWLTPAGRGLWWLLEEAYAETMPMLYDALRQQAAERAAGPV